MKFSVIGRYISRDLSTSSRLIGTPVEMTSVFYPRNSKHLQFRPEPYSLAEEASNELTKIFSH